MARKKGQQKVAVSEFAASAAQFIEGIKEMDGPLMITRNGKAAAYLLSAARYDGDIRKLAAYEEMSKALDEADKARREAHAGAIAEVTRRRRGLKS